MADSANTSTTDNNNNDDNNKPIVVRYCSVCSLPLEYCEFGPCLKDCKFALKEEDEDLFEEFYGGDTEPASNVDDDGKPDSKRDAKALKIIKGNKTEQQKGGDVVITTNQRQRRKYVTNIVGLKNYGLKPNQVAKQFGKHFACSASVVDKTKGEIDIQGDVANELEDFIISEFDIPKGAIKQAIGKRRK